MFTIGMDTGPFHLFSIAGDAALTGRRCNTPKEGGHNMPAKRSSSADAVRLVGRSQIAKLLDVSLAAVDRWRISQEMLKSTFFDLSPETMLRGRSSSQPRPPRHVNPAFCSNHAPNRVDREDILAVGDAVEIPIARRCTWVPFNQRITVMRFATPVNRY